MGKGNRNRVVRAQDRISNPKKYEQKKPLPKWLAPAISIVVLVAIVFGATFAILNNAGTFQRAQILIKSETGKNDVNRQMAVYLAWQSQYYNAYTYYYYCQLGYYEDSYGITSTYSSAEDYAMSAATYGVQETLRDSIDSVVDGLIQYVAVCDAAVKAGVQLDDADYEEVDAAVDVVENLQEKYSYTSLNKFLEAAICSGLRVRDIRNAMKLVALYEKFAEQKNDEFKAAVTDADITAYVKDNASTFYSTDYLVYATEDSAFKDQLLAATDTDAFKMLIADKTFADQYKTVFNEKNLLATATATYNESIKGKTNTGNGQVLTDAMTTLGATAKTYLSTETIDETLKAWLFGESAAENATAVLMGDENVYIVAITSVSTAEDVTTVNVMEKTYAREEGTTVGTDTQFKEKVKQEVYKDLALSEESTLDVSDYKTASQKADALYTELNAAEDKAAAISAKSPVAVTSSDADLPSEISSKFTAVTAEDAGKLFNLADSDNTAYILYVATVDEDNETATGSYLKVEDDMFYQVVDAMVTALSKEIPSAKTAGFNAAPTAGSYEEWLFGNVGDDFASPVAENATTAISAEKDSVTTYSVYMVSGAPMYKDTSIVFSGAYLSCADETARDAALAAIDGKTGTDLTDALYAHSSSTNVSDSLTASTLSSIDYNMYLWFSNSERVANDVTYVDAVSGNGYYVAVYLESVENWKYSAKSGQVNKVAQEWLDGLTENYSASEKVLARFGEPTSTETTAES